MKYRLGWLAHWSTKHVPSDDRVIVTYHRESDGWYEHEYFYYFIADTDEEAKLKAKKFIDQYSGDDGLEIYSVSNTQTGETILTEEEY